MSNAVRKLGKIATPLLIAAALPSAGCVSITANPVVAGTDLTSPGIDVSMNFSAELPTGWTTESGNPIVFTVARSGGSASDVLECRASLKTQISSEAFADCSAGTFTPTPVAGRLHSVPLNNGTYSFEVRRKDSTGAVIASDAQDFYVHPALDSVPSCSEAIADETYFAAAAAYLDMSTAFGASTSLKAPFYDVEFMRGGLNHMNNVAAPFTRVARGVSLRKRVTANGDQTLMILRRARAKWYMALAGSQANDYQSGAFNCAVSVPYDRQGSRTSSYKLVADGLGGYENFLEKSFAFTTPARRSFANVVSGNWNGDMGIVAELQGIGNPALYYNNRNATQHYRYPGGVQQAFINELDLLVGEGKLASNPFWGWGIRWSLQCDAVVFNAWGRGLCFHSGATVEPLQLASVKSIFASRNDYHNPGAGNASNKLDYHSLFRPRLVNDGVNTTWETWADANPLQADDVVDKRGTFLNP